MSELNIKYKGKRLVLAPGQSIEIERSNPMFMFDSYTGEHSSQIIILAEEETRAAIGNELFLELSAKKKVKIDVEVFDGETFSYYATAVLSSNYTHRTFENKGNITATLLFGFSRFFNKIKDKKATTLYLGGEITKNFTTDVVTDGSDGYLQHFYLTRNNSDDYLFAPIINDTSDENIVGYGQINGLDANNNLSPFNWLSLQPRVKYILEQILFENGYKLDASLLSGTGWENLFYVSFYAIKYFEITWTQTWLGSGYDNVPSLSYNSTVTYRIADAFSKEVTVQDLFFETCKRYGWIPLFNNANNTCKLFPLKNGKLMDKVDFTKYAAQDFTADFSADDKKISFKNTFPSGDSLPSAPNFDNLKKENPVLNFSDLPSPLGSYDNSIIYVANENKYYKIDLDATTNQRIWVVFADNIYDEIAKNETDSIESKVTTLPIYKTLLRTISGTDYYAYLPWAKQDVQSEWGIRTLYYHGIVRELLVDGSDGVLGYPYLSSICVLPDTAIAASWSNVFTHVINGVDYGIINKWFKDWIDLTASVEEDEQKIWLPFNEMKNLRFDTKVLLFNKLHLIKSYIEPLPYLGFIQAKTLSLLKATSSLVTASGVYVKLVWEDTQPGADIYLYTSLLADNVTKSKPVVYVYAYAAGTIPLSIINLNIKLKIRVAAESSGIATVFTPYADYHFSLTGISKEFCNSILHSDTTGYIDIAPNSFSPYFVIRQHLILNPSTDFLLNDFILDTSADYTIIP